HFAACAVAWRRPPADLVGRHVRGLAFSRDIADNNSTLPGSCTGRGFVLGRPRRASPIFALLAARQFASRARRVRPHQTLQSVGAPSGASFTFDSGNSMSAIPLTVGGAERLQAELHRLKTVDRPEVINAIAEARAQGDLSENAEYDAARERQAFIEGRIKELEGTLSNAQII